MIITISGSAGSGKSSVADALSKRLGWKRFSVGDFRRKKAAELGLSLNEYNKLGEKKDFTDKEADEWQAELGKTEDNFIIDGRLSFHFIPHSIKIFLDAKLEERAKRIYDDQRESEMFSSLEDALEKVDKRGDSDKKRYRKYYDIDPFDYSRYDIVIDTTKLTVKETVEKVLEKLKLVKP